MHRSGRKVLRVRVEEADVDGTEPYVLVEFQGGRAALTPNMVDSLFENVSPRGMKSGELRTVMASESMVAELSAKAATRAVRRRGSSGKSTDAESALTASAQTPRLHSCFGYGSVSAHGHRSRRHSRQRENARGRVPCPSHSEWSR